MKTIERCGLSDESEPMSVCVCVCVPRTFADGLQQDTAGVADGRQVGGLVPLAVAPVVAAGVGRGHGPRRGEGRDGGRARRTRGAPPPVEGQGRGRGW